MGDGSKYYILDKEVTKQEYIDSLNDPKPYSEQEHLPQFRPDLKPGSIIDVPEQAMHLDDGKLPFDLLPVRPLEYIARVFEYGSKKYAQRNWEKGMPWSKLVGSIFRHMYSFWRGEDFDPESDLHHLAHVGANVLMLMDIRLRHKEKFDDRSI